MRRLAVVLALACLAGCAALTPDEIRAANRKFVVASAANPFAAISCATRRIEEIDSGLRAGAVRESAQPGSFESVIRADTNNVAVIESRAASNGTTLTLWNRQEFPDSYVRLLTDAVTGC